MAKICPICNEKIKGGGVKTTDAQICFMCANISPNSRTEDLDSIKSYWEENNRRNSVFNKTLELKNFMSDTVIIDSDNELFYLFNKKSKRQPIIYSYNEVEEYSIESEDGKTVTKKKGALGRGVIGGVVFGGVGAIIGATSAKEESKVVGETDYLKVIMKTRAGGQRLILTNPPIGIMGFLDKCMETSAHSEEATKESTEHKYIAEELTKLSDLVKEGIITAEEFEKQKKRLLG